MVDGLIIEHTLNGTLTDLISVGTCVIAIAMLDTFSRGSLPGLPSRRYSPSDKARLENAWDAACRIDFHCIQTGEVGWTYMGKFAIP